MGNGQYILSLGKRETTSPITFKSDKPDTTQELLTAGFGLASVFLTALVTKSASTKGSDAPSEAEQKKAALLEYISSPEGIASELESVTKVITDTDAELKKLTDLKTGKVEKDIKTLNDKISKLNSDSYNGFTAAQIEAAITKRETALSGIDTLEAKFDTDKGVINSYKSTANATIGDIQVGSDTIHEPTVNENGIASGSYAAEYQSILAKCETKTLPDKNAPDYQTKVKAYNEYISITHQQEVVDAKQKQLDAKCDAIQELNNFKVKYGENLDGLGGTYAAQMKTHQADIDEVNNMEKMCPEGFAAQEKIDDYTKQISDKETLIDAYKKEAKDTEDNATATKPVLDQTKINARMTALQKIKATASEYKKDLDDLASMNTSVETLQNLDDDLNENDGNWFTRLFSSKKRGLRKERKSTQANLTTAQTQLAKASQAVIKKYKLEAALGTDT